MNFYYQKKLLVRIISTFLPFLLLNCVATNQPSKQSSVQTCAKAANNEGVNREKNIRIAELIENHNYQLLRQYLSSYPIDLNATIDYDTPLIIAIKGYSDYRYDENQQKTIDLLLELGANPNQKVCYYPLYLPVKSTTAIIEAGIVSKKLQNYLIEKSNNEVTFDKQIIVNAIENSDLSIFTRFKNSNQKIDMTNLIHRVIFSKNSDNSKLLMLKILIEKGADVNYVNMGYEFNFEHRFTTPLMEAIENYKVLELLLQSGANPNKPGNGRAGGFTPMHAAIAYDNIEIVELLVKYGGDFKNPTKYLDVAKSEKMKNYLFGIK